VTDSYETPISVKFTFQHLLSVLQLDLKGAEPGIKLTRIIVEMLDETGEDFLVLTKGTVNFKNEEKGNGKITQKEGKNKLVLNLESLVELPTDKYAQFYMTISPGHSGQTFKVTAITDMGETLEIGSMKVPADGAIPQGAKAYKSFIVNPPVKKDVDYASAIDLSANATANTYIVNAPNTVYKFKAQVMGNGVVPTKMAEIVTSTELAPKTALSLWYTCKQTSTKWIDAAPVDATSITLKDGYIYFKTPETFVNGNIVIAAFAEEGLTYSNITVNENREFTNATILWSWDIWAVEGYNPETTKIDMEGYSVMDRNLGATSATPGEVGALGLLYQWGRKDPFLGSSSTSDGLLAASTGNWGNISTTQDIDYTVRNPMTFIYSPSDWYTLSCTSADHRWEISEKTLYDPCPAGYKVTDTYFGIKEEGKFDFINYGVYLNLEDGTSAWYPAVGYLRNGYGDFNNVGNLAFYWTSHMIQQYANASYCLYLDLSIVRVFSSSISGSRSDAYAVRCVRE
jgi:hypothetical protein